MKFASAIAALMSFTSIAYAKDHCEKKGTKKCSTALKEYNLCAGSSAVMYCDPTGCQAMEACGNGMVCNGLPTGYGGGCTKRAGEDDSDDFAKAEI